MHAVLSTSTFLWISSLTKVIWDPTVGSISSGREIDTEGSSGIINCGFEGYLLDYHDYYFLLF